MSHPDLTPLATENPCWKGRVGGSQQGDRAGSPTDRDRQEDAGWARGRKQPTETVSGRGSSFCSGVSWCSYTFGMMALTGPIRLSRIKVKSVMSRAKPNRTDWSNRPLSSDFCLCPPRCSCLDHLPIPALPHLPRLRPFRGEQEVVIHPLTRGDPPRTRTRTHTQTQTPTQILFSLLHQSG